MKQAWWEVDGDTRKARAEMAKLPRAAKMRAFMANAREFDRAVGKCPRRMWGWSPRPGKHWSIREVIWHLADTEANIFVRLRKAACEPGSAVVAWDQEKWSKGQGYRGMDPHLALALWGVLRESNVTLLKRLPAGAWSRRVKHPDYGPITLEWNVTMGAWHLRNHLAQILRRLREWKQR